MFTQAVVCNRCQGVMDAREIENGKLPRNTLIYAGLFFLLSAIGIVSFPCGGLLIIPAMIGLYFGQKVKVRQWYCPQCGHYIPNVSNNP